MAFLRWWMVPDTDVLSDIPGWPRGRPEDGQARRSCIPPSKRLRGFVSTNHIDGTAA